VATDLDLSRYGNRLIHELRSSNRVFVDTAHDYGSAVFVTPKRSGIKRNYDSDSVDHDKRTISSGLSPSATVFVSIERLDRRIPVGLAIDPRPRSRLPNVSSAAILCAALNPDNEIRYVLA